MFTVKNNGKTPLGLPGGIATLEPGGSATIKDSWVLENPVVVNWIRSGRITLNGASSQGLGQDADDKDQPRSQKSASRPRVVPDSEVLEILNKSIPEIVELLPSLSDEEFDAVVRAEKNGKTRAGLSGEGKAFDQEWKRRYGIPD